MLTARRLIEKRRYYIVGAFLVSAMLTPPDVLLQLALVVPLLGLYQALIAYVRWSERD